ncbi:LysR family transcriptional regulator [Bradyrhizobium sp. 190]|uniref:LysR substrate-binding domain-containing protein n=1 Tax=Bradyrhizobium sp. 190 TaxID=2782658 RepID=UPI001FF94175|nr:LysR substrate-binding domain-containing protein [Bradyrhizobium sp. 190]MCK1518454.1 LysR family transcriptional regulator [Bradyrhizobium sp. 190]
MLSIRELEVFRRVMELGTVTAAAEALHISQPAVSRTLQQAERRLGFSLFLRRKKRLLPTPEARSLFSETVRAFAAFDVVQKRAADLGAGRAGGLNIAAISAFANALLPSAIAKFCRSRPDVVITLQSMSALQVATHVANHQADLGFVIDSIAAPGVSVTDLWATDFGCVMPRTHPLASKLHIAPADIEHETLICLSRQLPLGIHAVRVFADADVPLKIAIEVSQSTVACALVRAGAGLALLDGLGAMGAPATDLVTRPFYPPVKVTGRLVRPRHLLPSRLTREFIDTLSDVIEIQNSCADTADGVAIFQAASAKNS